MKDEPPRRQRRADGGRDDRDGRTVGGHARHQHSVDRSTPVRMCQHAGTDIGQEHRRQDQQELLDAVEAPAQHQNRHDDRGGRDTGVTTDPEQLETGGDPGELGTRRADVGDNERGQHGTGQSHAIPLTHQADEPLPGDHPHACRQAVEQYERHRGQHEHPQQLVAVVCAEHRIGGDACGVVVGKSGEQARTEHREKSAERNPFAPNPFHEVAPPPLSPFETGR